MSLKKTLIQIFIINSVITLFLHPFVFSPDLAIAQEVNFGSESTSVFQETFETNLPKQDQNTCTQTLENQKCVFLRSVENGSIYFGDRAKKTYFIEGSRIQGSFQMTGDRGLTIPDKEEISLKLNSKLEVERGLDFDKAVVQIQDQNNSTNQKEYDLKIIFNRLLENKYLLDEAVLLDLSQFRSKKVDLFFKFDTIDQDYNEHFGWEIYDIEILAN